MLVEYKYGKQQRISIFKNPACAPTRLLLFTIYRTVAPFKLSTRHVPCPQPSASQPGPHLAPCPLPHHLPSRPLSGRRSPRFLRSLRNRAGLPPRSSSLDSALPQAHPCSPQSTHAHQLLHPLGSNELDLAVVVTDGEAARTIAADLTPRIVTGLRLATTTTLRFCMASRGQVR